MLLRTLIQRGVLDALGRANAHVRLGFLLVLLGLGWCVTCQRSDDLGQLFHRLTQHQGPGLAVLMRQGERSYQATFGYADLATKERITSHTRFRLASVTKQFTGFAIALLEARQLLQVQDPVQKYLPTFPAYAKDVTIHHLLHHLSGLPEYTVRCRPDATAAPITNAEILAWLHEQPGLESPPGSHYADRNTGYVVLAAIIEAVSQQRFADFLQTEIFAKLGMHDTFIVSGEAPQRARVARAYGAWPFFAPSPAGTCDATLGDDGVFSSLADLQRWMMSLEQQTLVTAQTLQHIFRPTQTSAGDPVPYGYGWVLEAPPEFSTTEPTYYHSGRWAGYHAVLLRIPARQFWAILLSNYEDLDLRQVWPVLARQDLRPSIVLK